jgi:hypothetical protein
MTTGLDIVRTATTWLELHGENAIPDARRMAAEMRARGDLDGADTWLRIIVAIEELERHALKRPS